MAKLVLRLVVKEARSGTYLLYDGACGTGGMLTAAEETLRQLAGEHLYGQEFNAAIYAICKTAFVLKGGEAADNMVGDPEHSPVANDTFPSREFDFMLLPYGKSWKTVLLRAEHLVARENMDGLLAHRALEQSADEGRPETRPC